MIDTRTAPAAILLLRVTLGVLFVAHGLLKLFVFTPGGTAAFFESLGLPGFLGHLTLWVEIVGGILLIAGIYARAVALALIPILIGAWAFAHADNGWLFSNEGGGWEFIALWISAQLSLALAGDGPLALVKTPFGQTD